MSKSSGPVSVNVQAATATATASRAHGVGHQPHESAECRDRLKGFVLWGRWTHKSLWTPEQGFTLIKDYDPDEFSQVKEIPNRTQSSELYPFGGTEAHVLQEATHDAVLLGKLEVFHLKDKRDLTPLELFKEAQVKSAAFLAWAVELPWFKSFDAELPAQLTAMLAPVATEKPAPDDAHIFRREPGDIWTIRMGDEMLQLKELAGFIYIREAIRNPGKSMSFIDLFKALDMPPDEKIIIDADAPATLDGKARTQYQARLEELKEKRAQCLALDDEAGADHVETEIDKITEQLLTGFKKKTINKKIEDAVRKKIKSSLDKISLANPVIGQHFFDHMTMENLALMYRCATAWTT